MSWCGCGPAAPLGPGEVCPHVAAGYPWCRPCAEHHRPPECPINERGEALAPCGCTWAAAEAAAHDDGGCPQEASAEWFA